VIDRKSLPNLNQDKIMSNTPTEAPAKMLLFATPESGEALQKYIEQFNGSESVVAHTCAYMAYNLMCQYIEDNYHTDLKASDTDDEIKEITDA
jgi:hypothetical protein